MLPWIRPFIWICTKYEWGPHQQMDTGENRISLAEVTKRPLLTTTCYYYYYYTYYVLPKYTEDQPNNNSLSFYWVIFSPSQMNWVAPQSYLQCVPLLRWAHWAGASHGLAQSYMREEFLLQRDLQQQRNQSGKRELSGILARALEQQSVNCT